jgi:hypothetical protein
MIFILANFAAETNMLNHENKVESILKLFCNSIVTKPIFFTILFLSGFSLSAQVTIGTGTSTQSHPFNAFYGYGRSASVYTYTEIGSYGIITNLGWYVATAQSTSVPLKIYIKETSSTTLSANTWANMISGATLVYDASVSFSSTGWKTIDVADFTYSSNNLLILCEANYGGTGTSSYPLFRYSTAASKHMFLHKTIPPRLEMEL